MSTAPGLPSLPALDGVRGIALVWVVLFHYAVLRPEGDSWLELLGRAPMLDSLVRNGYLGVDLFFLLSGFLLALPWVAGRAPGTREFYRRRVRRILPAYYVHLLVLFAVLVPLLRGADYWRQDFFVMAWNVVAHGTFLHMTSPLTSGSVGVNGALWTLALEAQFYLLLPLVAHWIARAPGTAALLAFVAAAAWQWAARHGLDALVAAFMRLGAHWAWPEPVVRHLLLTQLPSYLGHFALGALGASLWWRHHSGELPVGRPVVALGAATGIGLLVWVVVGGARPLGDASLALVTLGLGTFVLAAALARHRAVIALLGRGPLALLGRVSYSGYLYHLPLLLLWLPAARRLPDALGLPLYLALVAAVAYASWRFIERRFWTERPR